MVPIERFSQNNFQFVNYAVFHLSILNQRRVFSRIFVRKSFFPDKVFDNLTHIGKVAEQKK